MSYENLKNELGQSTNTLFQWSVSKQNFLPELVFNQHVLAPLDSVTLDTFQGRPLICPTALRKAFPRPLFSVSGVTGTFLQLTLSSALLHAYTMYLAPQELINLSFWGLVIISFSPLCLQQVSNKNL